jgi:hypothetical protein
MSILQQANTGEGTGKKFRLIVRSAEEAVRVIRDKLGDNAKVISVRQVGGEGVEAFYFVAKARSDCPSSGGQRGAF